MHQLSQVLAEITETSDIHRVTTIELHQIQELKCRI